jgi:hypothetical protein
LDDKKLKCASTDGFKGCRNRNRPSLLLQYPMSGKKRADTHEDSRPGFPTILGATSSDGGKSRRAHRSSDSCREPRIHVPLPRRERSWLLFGISTESKCKPTCGPTLEASEDRPPFSRTNIVESVFTNSNSTIAPLIAASSSAISRARERHISTSCRKIRSRRSGLGL